jgi:hypothetical protein
MQCIAVYFLAFFKVALSMLYMKRIEIIIPPERLTDTHNVLKDVNLGGISHYRIANQVVPVVQYCNQHYVD